MKIEYQKNALIVLIGAMGTGKSTFTRKHFFAHDIVESDYIRKQLSGNFEDQTYNDATFEILYATIEARAKAGILTVIDSTGSRGVLDQVRAIGKKYHRELIAIKFPHLTPEELTPERMQHRMKVLHAYHNQVKRIDNTVIHSDYTLYELSKNDVNDSLVKPIADTNYYIDASKKHVVIPDLHGVYQVVEHVYAKYIDDANYSFIFLGDIVDRGESSYKTFRLVKNLLDSNRAKVVASNHDFKFYRYLKKWKEDGDESKYFEPSEFDEVTAYGMHLSHGMEGTVREFYSLSTGEMNWYADSFIQYFENALPHMILDRDNTKHYFVHAGISHNSARGFSPTVADRDSAMYKTVKTVDEVIDRFKGDKKKIILHVGHNYMYDAPRMFGKGNHALYMHDVGIGKRDINYAGVVEQFVII